MATRKSYSDEQKQELIKKYKTDYVNSSRSFIKGEKITEELFNSLHQDVQWHKIYMNYVRKNESKEKELFPAGKIKTSYAKIRSALNTIKNSVDSMTENQINKTFNAFEEIKQYYTEKKLREQEQKVKELEDKEIALKEQLEKILAAKAKLREV